MSHQVIWTRDLLESFIEKGCLSEEEAQLMRYRVINKHSIVKISLLMNCSESKVNAMFNRLKKLYDEVAAEDNSFPPRVSKNVYNSYKSK